MIYQTYKFNIHILSLGNFHRIRKTSLFSDLKSSFSNSAFSLKFCCSLKQITILLIAIIISIIGISQNQNRIETHGEVKKYIDESIFPKLKKQQISYLSQLS